MAEETIKRQWILNAKNEKVAPYTLMSQVIHDASGDTLDIYLDNFLNKINNKINIENTYILSQSMQTGENEEDTLKRLLNISSSKVILLDKSVEISSSLIIPSDTYLIGCHKDITITKTGGRDYHIIEIIDDISNVYLSNFSIRASMSKYAISIGNLEKTVNCENCIIDNIKCIDGLGCSFYANNLILNNLTITDGSRMISAKYGLECNGTNFNIKNCTINNHNQVTMEINNSNIDNLTISNYCRDILFSGNNNTYNNIVSINNNHYVKIAGNNIFYQGKNLNNAFNNFSEIPEQNDNVGDFVLDIHNSTMILTAIKDINNSTTSFIYGVKFLSKNSDNILILNGNYGDNALDYWASSDLQTAIPLLLDTNGCGNDRSISFLGDGKLLINGIFEEEIFPFKNLVYVSNDKDTIYPVYLSIINKGSGSSFNEEEDIYLYFSSGGPNPDYSWKISPNEKVSSKYIVPYSSSRGLFLSGTFDNTIISLQSIISVTSSKTDIGIPSISII